MKIGIYFALVIGLGGLALSPANADRWVYEGATYSDYADCPKGGRHTNMAWRGPESRSFEKAVLYRNDKLSWNGKVIGKNTALLQWSKPFVNPSSGKIQMTLNGKPMEGNTTAKIGYQGYTEKGKWGSGARASANKQLPLKGKQHWLKLDTNGPKRAQRYEIHIYAHDGGKCRSNNLAIYRFHKVKEFTDVFENDCDRFVEIRNAGIPGHNTEVASNISLRACKQKCQERSWCKSIDYERRTRRCYIQNVNKNDVSLKTNYSGNPYDHYYCSGR